MTIEVGDTVQVDKPYGETGFVVETSTHNRQTVAFLIPVGGWEVREPKPHFADGLIKLRVFTDPGYVDAMIRQFWQRKLTALAGNWYEEQAVRYLRMRLQRARQEMIR